MAYIVTKEHHSFAEKAFQSGQATKVVREAMKAKFKGLSNAQANDACTTARKHLGIYKSLKKELKEQKRQAKQNAQRQAERKTEVNQDA